MTDSDLQSEAEQDRFLLVIYSLSREIAIGLVKEEDVDDIVHDVAVQCLDRLRARDWTHTPADTFAFVWRLVNSLIVDLDSRAAERAEHDGLYIRKKNARSRAAVQRDRSRESQGIRDCDRRVLARLSYRCRTAFYLAREARASTREIAVRLHVSPRTVHGYIKRAARALEKPFAAMEMAAASATPRGRPRGARQRGDQSRLAPRYPAPALVSTTR